MRHFLSVGDVHPRVTRCHASALCAALLAAAMGGPVYAEVTNPYGVAVIIGNRSYAHERVPEVAYAHRDADAFRRFVLDVLGFNPDNLIDLRDASQAEMETAFGNERRHEGKVWRYLHPRHGSDVVVFYSGHGVPGLQDGRGYLLPVDADPDSAEINGYPIDVLYANLGKLEDAKTVRVFLDACFSGDSDQGMLVRSASPVYVQAALPEAAGDKLTILAAASGREVASWDDEAQHGLFTRHLLDALYGAGDADSDGAVTAAEAKTYLDDTMTLAARREFGRHQNANLNGAADAVLASAGEAGAFPTRAESGEAGEAASGGVEPVASAPAQSAEEGEEALGGSTPVELSVTDTAEQQALPEPPVFGKGPEMAEASLGLERSERRLIQQGLAALGFDPGPVDGLFGRGTRGVIGQWQVSRGEAKTGYLDAELARVLLAAAREFEAAVPESSSEDIRAESLTAERLAAEREFWASVKESKNPAELDAYLEAYPGGIYENLARRKREALVAAADDVAFARAGSLGTVESYGEYLLAYPTGRHVNEVRRRQSALQADSEVAKVNVEEETEHPAPEWTPGTVFQDCVECPEMVVLPPVASESIAVGRYEVTFAEWDVCRRSGGCAHPAHDRGRGRGRRPVTNVSWHDAREYVNWLSLNTGKTYRLLSESEWERASLSEDPPYHWGSFYSSPVGSSAPNVHGLYDMAANVWEWLESCSRTKGCTWYVVRGGLWRSAYWKRSRNRNEFPPTKRSDDIGFRVVSSLE